MSGNHFSRVLVTETTPAHRSFAAGGNGDAGYRRNEGVFIGGVINPKSPPRVNRKSEGSLILSEVI